MEVATAQAEMEQWDTIVNRLYQASFYAVSALFYQENERAKTHSETKGQFNELFI